MKNNSLLLIVCLSTGLLAGCSKEKPTEACRENNICVKTETLVETAASVPIEFTGGLLSVKLMPLAIGYPIFFAVSANHYRWFDKFHYLYTGSLSLFCISSF